MIDLINFLNHYLIFEELYKRSIHRIFDQIQAFYVYKIIFTMRLYC